VTDGHSKREMTPKEKFWGIIFSLLVVSVTAAATYAHHVIFGDGCQSKAEKQCICQPTPNASAPNIGGNY